jgi:SAM-dependent methyltransferase
VGAGTGQFTMRLVESGCDLTAVEISEATAAVCQERVGDRADVVVGNVETAEGIAGRTFDAVVGVSVLHHIDLDLFLRNTLLPLLRPGGRFAFSEPNMANPQVWAERNIRPIGRMRHTTEHETAFRAAELRATLERAGLTVDVCEPFEFLHPSTPRSLIGLVERLERRLESSPARAIAGSVRVAGSR